MMRSAWLAALAFASATPLAAQDAPAWRPVDDETGQIRDVDGLRALANAFPDSGSVRIRLLQAQLGAGNIAGVLESLAWLKERGYVFSEGAQARIPQLVGEKHADAASALVLRKATVIEASEVVATVPADAGLVESVFSPDEDVFAVTSITSGSLHISIPGRPWIAAPIPGAGDMSGIVSEEDDRAGWIASSNLDGSEDVEPKFNGLMQVSSDFSDPLLVPAPDGVALSDLAIDDEGRVYASDPMNGGVYRTGEGGETLEVLVEPGSFRSPQGAAVSADGTRLYISDYRYGLAMINLATGKVFRLGSDVPVILDGTDGLWLHEGELIAVQNGTSPMRISAFTLSDNGQRITAARVLEQAHSGWTEPLGGSIVGDALIYVATGQWDRYEKGKLREGMDAIPTEIRRLPLK